MSCVRQQEEYARAVRDVVKQLLRTALLPRLLAEAEPALWLHLAEEAVAFECQLAQVCSHRITQP